MTLSLLSVISQCFFCGADNFSLKVLFDLSISEYTFFKGGTSL